MEGTNVVANELGAAYTALCDGGLVENGCIALPNKAGSGIELNPEVGFSCSHREIGHKRPGESQ